MSLDEDSTSHASSSTSGHTPTRSPTVDPFGTHMGLPYQDHPQMPFNQFGCAQMFVMPGMMQQCDMVNQMIMQNMVGFPNGARETEQMMKQNELHKQLMMQQFLSMMTSGMVSPMSMTQFFEVGKTEADHRFIDNNYAANECKKEDSEEWPLDLSRKSGSVDSPDTTDSIDVVGLSDDSPKDMNDFKLEPSGSDDGKASSTPKRNYSQRDLTAAVEDIRCGKLGTRRASVVYGIPRSTLRNKIYKLEAAQMQAGKPMLFKRRKPGGQSNAEKKLADAVEREKKIQSTSPRTDCSSRSPSQSESEAMDVIESTKKDLPWEKSPNCDWTSRNFWKNLITQPKTEAESKVASLLQPSTLVINRSAVTDNAATILNGEWKKTRPKRGQYRKYDKDALDRAVRSVRSGEMSVHRAGSFYGVPHSTLEYKVKERNLMRPKRKKHDDYMDGPPTLVQIPAAQAFSELQMNQATIESV